MHGPKIEGYLIDTRQQGGCMLWERKLSLIELEHGRSYLQLPWERGALLLLPKLMKSKGISFEPFFPKGQRCAKTDVFAP